MPMPGPMEWGIILVIVIIIFGTGKLGEVGGALGKAVREFRESMGKPEPKDEPKPEVQTNVK